jgi:hypothetical protein
MKEIEMICFLIMPFLTKCYTSAPNSPTYECSAMKVKFRGEMVEVIYPTYNISLFEIVTMNPPCTMNI